MGMGRNSSRIASRRIATSKDSGNYREDLDEGKLVLFIGKLKRIMYAFLV